MEFYVIKNSDLKDFYWSTELGWASYEEATLFTSPEMLNMELPQGGEWILA